MNLPGVTHARKITLFPKLVHVTLYGGLWVKWVQKRDSVTHALSVQSV